jgi:hypothetical protein
LVAWDDCELVAISHRWPAPRAHSPKNAVVLSCRDEDVRRDGEVAQSWSICMWLFRLVQSVLGRAKSAIGVSTTAATRLN